MITRYSVVQYVPNPLADERINIGVIAWDERDMSAKFLSNWKRVQSFGHEDLGYVCEFVAKASTALDRNVPSDLFGGTPTLDVSKLEKMIGTWHHSIILTRRSVRHRTSHSACGVKRIIPHRSRRRAVLHPVCHAIPLFATVRVRRGRLIVVAPSLDCFVDGINRKGVGQARIFLKRDTRSLRLLADRRVNVRSEIDDNAD
jgi:hypothetical protein